MWSWVMHHLCDSSGQEELAMIYKNRFGGEKFVALEGINFVVYNGSVNS